MTTDFNGAVVYLEKLIEEKRVVGILFASSWFRLLLDGVIGQINHKELLIDVEPNGPSPKVTGLAINLAKAHSFEYGDMREAGEIPPALSEHFQAEIANICGILVATFDDGMLVILERDGA